MNSKLEMTLTKRVSSVGMTFVIHKNVRIMRSNIFHNYVKISTITHHRVYIKKKVNNELLNLSVTHIPARFDENTTITIA